MTPILFLGFMLALGDVDRPTILIVRGAPGSPDYEPTFTHWGAEWRSAADKAGARSLTIGESAAGPESDHDLLRKAFADQSSEHTSQLWIIMIGHGTFDGHDVKFNLRGPDVSGLELAEWLKPITRPVVLLACFSGSGPLINRLSRRDRVIVTATKSGAELNATRFGQYLAETTHDLKADLDKDGQVSVLEAFLTASGRTAQSYREQSRLATEHALLDDNGDGLGTPAEWFQGVRAIRRAKNDAPLDGLRAGQIALVPSDRERKLPPEVRRRRDALELELGQLRDEKSKLAEPIHDSRLEKILLELARLYEKANALEPPGQ